MLSPEQLEQRRGGIGSSDIAAIADLDPHRGPIDVWLDKLGLAATGETTATWCGDRLEDAIAKLYEERTGASLYKPTATSVHAEVPIALATPDRFAHRGPAQLVEIKNVGGFMAHLWADGPPVDKVIQVQWQLEVCDLELAHIAALLGGTDFQIYTVERDREMAADLLELAQMFWDLYVVPREPPPHDGISARKLAALRWPIHGGAMLAATPEAEALRDRLLRVKRHAKRVGDLQAQLEARAMEMIGDAAGVDGCFTWKAPRGAGPWQAALRAAWRANTEAAWEATARQVGDDEKRWEALARAAGITSALTSEQQRNAGRRFLVKEPKAEKKGPRR